MYQLSVHWEAVINVNNKNNISNDKLIALLSKSAVSNFRKLNEEAEQPFECICKEQFEGPLCENPRNICDVSTLCEPHGLCELLVNSTAHWPTTFQCRCLDGYSPDPDLDAPNCDKEPDEKNKAAFWWILVPALIIVILLSWCTICAVLYKRRVKKRDREGKAKLPKLGEKEAIISKYIQSSFFFPCCPDKKLLLNSSEQNINKNQLKWN